jgi:hypothetical protein
VNLDRVSKCGIWQQKWDMKMNQKMVIIVKAMAWFDFPKMIIFHSFLISFCRLLKAASRLESS